MPNTRTTDDGDGADVVEGRGVTLESAISQAASNIRGMAREGGPPVDQVIIEEDRVVARVLAGDVLRGTMADDAVPA